MDLHLDLADGPDTSLRGRVEHALREAVRSGRLAPGSRLPSTRALCVQLSVSRGVVVEAYAQLAAEGYLHTRHGAGTVVAPAVAPSVSPRPSAKDANGVRFDMNPFRPALDGFPRSVWLGALGRVLRDTPDRQLGYPDPAGAPALRETLAAYLGRARGVRGDPAQIVVTTGMRQGARLVWSALAQQGARAVAVEEPGWAGMSETARDAGLRTVPVAVDDDGLIVQRLARERIDAVALAPAHQYPTGAVLAAPRRTELLAWAQSSGALIVEDDYDAEYRYDRQPIGSLQGLAPERIAYGGSASKTLAPAVRLGWMVVPQRLAEPMAELQRRAGGMPTTLLQLAFADLIERGEIDRHLRRQRRRYRRQREALMESLARELPELDIRGAAAGLYLALDLPAGADARAIAGRAREQGIALETLPGDKPALVLGYANLAPAAVAPAVRALAACVRVRGTERRPVKALARSSS